MDGPSGEKDQNNLPVQNEKECAVGIKRQEYSGSRSVALHDGGIPPMGESQYNRPSAKNLASREKNVRAR